MKQTITALIPAKNEADNIERCVHSVLWCDEVVVIDMSNDDTGNLAQKAGAKIIHEKYSLNDDFTRVQKLINEFNNTTNSDWILRIDADEEVTMELQNEIEDILNTHTEHAAFTVSRQQYFFGGFLKGGDWAYDRLVRLYRPHSAKYDPIVEVHEQFKVSGSIDSLQHSLRHYSHPNLDVAINKFNTYTTLEAKQIRDSYITALLKMIILPIYIFLRWFFWHKGHRDGLRGVIAGLYRSIYDFFLYSKYLERKHTG